MDDKFVKANKASKFCKAEHSKCSRFNKGLTNSYIWNETKWFCVTGHNCEDKVGLLHHLWHFLYIHILIKYDWMNFFYTNKKKTSKNKYIWIAKFIYLNRGRDMVFNSTFNNISAMLWWSVLLVEETGAPRENHQLAASHW